MPKPDWGGGLSSGIQGALAGGQIGGLWGAGAGGALGLGGGIFGSKKKKKKRSTFDKRQKQLNEQQHDSILGEGPLADLYNYDAEMANQVFDQNTARPAYRSFQENVIPSITGQFRNEGLMNSSYAGDALSRAGRDVQENLDGLRSQYLMGQESDARNAKRSAVENLQNRTTFDYDNSPQSDGFNIDSILGMITPQLVNQLKGFLGKGG